MKGFGHRRCTQWLEWNAHQQPPTTVSTGSRSVARLPAAAIRSGGRPEGTDGGL
jgi:hypothetical protein